MGGPDPPCKGIEGQFLRTSQPIVYYREYVALAVLKRLNCARCHLWCGVGWFQGARIRWEPPSIGMGNLEKAQNSFVQNNMVASDQSIDRLA